MTDLRTLCVQAIADTEHTMYCLADCKRAPSNWILNAEIVFEVLLATLEANTDEWIEREATAAARSKRRSWNRLHKDQIADLLSGLRNKEGTK